MKNQNLIKDEQGAVMVIFVLSLTTLLMFCSFALDFGLVYINVSKLQSALDAAVLAAGQKLPVSINDEAKQTEIRTTIRNYLIKNKMVDLSTLNISFTDVAKGQYIGLKASLSANTELNFAKIIGKNSISVAKSAQAKVLPSVRVSDVVPLGVKKTSIDEHLASGRLDRVPLKFGGGSGTGGDFGAIDLDGVKGGGASDFEQWLAFGYTKEMGIDDGLLPVESGNMAGPTAAALNLRYYRCTHFPSSGGCKKDNFVSTCPRVIKAPVVVYDTSKTVRIVGFAAFVLVSPADTMNGFIYGSYINMVLPGTPASTETEINEADYGIYSLRLSE